MSLLAILISLALEKLLPIIDGWRHWSWFGPFSQGVRNQLNKHPHLRGIPTILLILVLPMAGVGVVQLLLNDILALLGFIFSFIVLTYCLGPKDPHRLVHKYLDAVEAGDITAEETLEEILQQTPPEDPTERTTALVNTILIQTHERLFAVLFWFIVLGPIGAVLYRLTLEQSYQLQTNQDEDTEFRAAVDNLHYLLAWIPSHLAILSYAVMGSFVHALHAWKKKAEPAAEAKAETTGEENVEAAISTSTSQPEHYRLLQRIGLGALQFETKLVHNHNAVRETLGLCGRSLIAWVTVLALLTLAGWVS